MKITCADYVANRRAENQSRFVIDKIKTISVQEEMVENVWKKVLMPQVNKSLIHVNGKYSEYRNGMVLYQRKVKTSIKNTHTLTTC